MRYKLTLSPNTFAENAFPLGKRYLEFRVYHFEDLILTGNPKDEVEGLKISLVNETNTENAESVLELFSDWKVNSFKLDGF
eukprot:snap_masked-scaffold_13-processed-gene-6.23-mRNA-1 protein AED:1.00 eAED:1.00 QI:0/0/0/0/1/1/2/0/80